MNFDDDDYWRLYESDAVYWRLSEHLSVTNAAMLAAGIDPGTMELATPDAPQRGYFHLRESSNKSTNYFHSGSYVAVFSAIRNAILEDKLRANITHLARNAPFTYEGDAYAETPQEHEAEIQYTMLFRTGNAIIKTNAVNEDWGRYRKLYIVKEPDWNQTTVAVDDLKEWMANKNFRPTFFFPEVKPQEFKDTEHTRYSAKLAAAVSAWESVQAAEPRRTVKQTLVKWLNANAATFGLIDEDGKPLSTVVQSLSEVANWETGGGAPRTDPLRGEPPKIEREAIENFAPLDGPLPSSDDPEIPF